MPTPARPRGLHCPSCRGVRLVTTTTRRPIPGVTVRYRKCSACGSIIKTEERISSRPGPCQVLRLPPPAAKPAPEATPLRRAA